MILNYIVIILFYHNCEVFSLKPVTKETHQNLIECAVGISNKYFRGLTHVTYVGSELNDNEMLQQIHYTSVVPILAKLFTKKSNVEHKAYLLTGTNVSTVLEHFAQLIKERTWNPGARFLVFLRSLSHRDLKVFFDKMLDLHIDNVVLANGTIDILLYSYDPFKNYACGKHYDATINYGSCAHIHKQNLYPNKYVTGLQNCTFTGVITHWPPFSIVLPEVANKFPQLPLGFEPYLLKLIGDKEGFKLNIIRYPELDEFSLVDSNMVARGTLHMLQNHSADFRLGAMLLMPSRSYAFAYAYGHSTYEHEIQFLIKKAPNVQHWKFVYLEFDFKVWSLLILSFILYSLLMIQLIRTSDKFSVVLKLLNCLLNYSCTIQCRSTVKCVFIIWVWCAYFINTIYQSIFFSFLTNHPMEYQVSNEADLIKHQYTPCLGSTMEIFFEESTQGKKVLNSDCYNGGTVASVEAILRSDKKLYTIVPYESFQYPKLRFYDEFGNSRAYLFQEPFAKTVQVIYSYKGFPFVANISLGLLQLKENGIANKIYNDMIYKNNLRHHFHAKKFKTHFTSPWRLYLCGCILASITFIFELVINKYKIYKKLTSKKITL